MLCQSPTQMEPKVACFQSQNPASPWVSVCHHSQKGMNNLDILPTLHQIPSSSPSILSSVASATCGCSVSDICTSFCLERYLHFILLGVGCCPRQPPKTCVPRALPTSLINRTVPSEGNQAVTHSSICCPHEEWEWLAGWMDGAKQTEESLSSSDSFWACHLPAFILCWQLSWGPDPSMCCTHTEASGQKKKYCGASGSHHSFSSSLSLALLNGKLNEITFLVLNSPFSTLSGVWTSIQDTRTVKVAGKNIPIIKKDSYLKIERIYREVDG